ncbi:DUF2163 domain-containing protein [Planktotalea arctica]|uniref:DUF2163 domain-containing protein n=1 Tax=Planktotalea arctica TaxID=1481893 RepID=UPI003219A9E7
MSALPEAFQAHLDSGVTTLCRAWKIERRDGVCFGFTDHDLALEFDGLIFKPDTGLSAMALQQSTGLSVDNTEAVGALSDTAIKEVDIDAGRFDGAEVTSWLVNWTDTAQRILQFRGNIGEIRRAGGAFQAELRGLTDMLNRPVGRVYQRPCGAVLGDDACSVDLQSAAYRVQSIVAEVENARVYRFEGLGGYASDWFERGRLDVISGEGVDLSAAIKVDRMFEGLREITLWEPMRADIRAGDHVCLFAGCDKRFETCRVKFSNAVNFRGFPDIPEEEWMMVHPSKAPSKDGGSRR